VTERDSVPYSNPPIEEGLCQMSFATPVRWNVASPGLLFERLREEYPAEPQIQEQLQASFAAGGSQPGSANFEMNRGKQRYLYRDETLTRLLLVNEDMLSVNSLKPYEGWPHLRERITKAFDCVEGVLGRPTISAVTIRYINKIVIPSPVPIDTDRYFTLSIHTAERGHAALTSFIHRVESMLSDGRTGATSTFATLPAEAPEEPTFLLDLEFRRAFAEGVTPERALQEADELKTLENAEFESCITDKTRKLFG
jgi:uncharacterized protein (TIGR04255 family)